MDMQVLLAEHVLEVLQHFPEQFRQPGAADGQLVTDGGRTVELQELVREADHPVRVLLDRFHQHAVLFGKGLGALELLDRSVNQGKRRAEFVGHIGKEVGAFLTDLFGQELLLFRKLETLPVYRIPDIELNDGDRGQQDKQPIQYEHGPGEPGRRFYPEALYQLLFSPSTVRTLDTDPESVAARRQAGVSGPEAFTGRNPVPVIAVQAELERRPETRIIIGTGVIKGNLVGIMTKGIFLVTKLQ